MVSEGFEQRLLDAYQAANNRSIIPHFPETTHGALIRKGMQTSARREKRTENSG